MEEKSKRQLSIIEAAVKQYKNGEITLNTFIQTFEGVLSMVAESQWKETAFSILVDLEELNGVLLSDGRMPNETEMIFISLCLDRLTKSIADFLL